MDILELRKRILQGEDYHTEFKEILPNNEELATRIVCFANSDGGQLIIGVSNSGDIVGVTNLDETIRKIDDISFNRCEPPIGVLQETIDINGKSVLIVNIPKGEQRPYRTKSGLYYVRASNRCRQASWDEVRRLYQTSESVYYDEIPIAKAQLSDIDLDFFKNYLEKYFAVHPDIQLVENYLENLKITMNRVPTLAGIIFFGRQPQDYIPFANILAAYIPGEEISDQPADRKDLNGKILDIINDAERFLNLYLKEEHKIKDFEPEKYLELPMEVLREGLVNAVAHRDYTINSSIRLFIFKNRIEIRTPGRLPNTVTIENMKTSIHVLRNPTIYNLLSKVGLVTNIGSGVPRMIRLVKENLNKDIGLEVVDNEFVLTIPR